MNEPREHVARVTTWIAGLNGWQIYNVAFVMFGLIVLGTVNDPITKLMYGVLLVVFGWMMRVQHGRKSEAQDALLIQRQWEANQALMALVVKAGVVPGHQEQHPTLGIRWVFDAPLNKEAPNDPGEARPIGFRKD
jgi:hypothetical protein